MIVYSLISILVFIINVVEGNKGIFGFNNFVSQGWDIYPESSNECTSWAIRENKNITNSYLEVNIKDNCELGFRLTDTDDVDFFAAFQYYSDIEFTINVVKGSVDILIEEPDRKNTMIIKQFTAASSKGFETYVVPIPASENAEYSVLHFRNPSKTEPLTFYIRQARLIYITERPILDSLKLYGNDWSYDVIEGSMENNIVYKLMRNSGCFSIDLKDPYIGPFASMRFDIKAPKDFIFLSHLEINGSHYQYKVTEIENINEDEWTTAEITFKDMPYNELYDRLDLCNLSEKDNWFKVRNIYLRPTYNFNIKGGESQSCCLFNQCVCTYGVKKVYKDKNNNIKKIETVVLNSSLPFVTTDNSTLNS